MMLLNILEKVRGSLYPTAAAIPFIDSLLVSKRYFACSMR